MGKVKKRKKCRCGKVWYKTKKAAQWYARVMLKRDKNVMAAGAYPSCGGWHITSKPWRHLCPVIVERGYDKPFEIRKLSEDG